MQPRCAVRVNYYAHSIRDNVGRHVTILRHQDPQAGLYLEGPRSLRMQTSL